MKMRILTITTVFPNEVEPQLGIFVKQRMFTVAEMCELKVVAPVSWYKFLASNFRISSKEIQKGIKVYHPHFFYIPRFFKSLDGFFFFLSVCNCVQKIKRHFKFDLIDAHFAYPDGFGAVLLSKVLKKPVVVTLRGTVERLKYHPIIRKQIKWTLKNATNIIAVSDSLKRRAIELGIPGDKITVIRNGIDAKKFHPIDKLEARKKLGLPIGKKIILSVGGLVERKGFHHVIDILPDVTKEIPNLYYVIVGGKTVEGDMTDLLKRKIKDLKLNPYVMLAGPKPHNELIFWYNAADVFCLYSSKEGCPNVILEALACGTPVVASKVGGAPEIIINEDLGFLVDNKEQLKQALIKAFNKNWNTKTIVQYGSQNTWDKVARKVIKVFEEAVQYYQTDRKECGKYQWENVKKKLMEVISK